MQTLSEMAGWKKFVLVIAGYVLAFAASIGVVALYDLQFTAADNQAMGGMIAGGEMMLGGAVFYLVSLLPTGLALWFLRSSRAFWSAISVAGLAFAIIGLAAVLTPLAVGGASMRAPALVLVGFFSIVQMMGAPLWVGGFLLFALLAPARDLRQRMLVAAAIEVFIGVCGVVHFLVPSVPI